MTTSADQGAIAEVGSPVLIAPDRTRLLLARALAYAVTAIGVGLLMIAVGFVVGIPLLGTTDGPNPAVGDYLAILGGGLLTCALGATLGGASRSHRASALILTSAERERLRTRVSLISRLLNARAVVTMRRDRKYVWT